MVSSFFTPVLIFLLSNQASKGILISNFFFFNKNWLLEFHEF